MTTIEQAARRLLDACINLHGVKMTFGQSTGLSVAVDALRDAIAEDDQKSIEDQLTPTRFQIQQLAHRRCTRYTHHDINPMYSFTAQHLVDFVREIQEGKVQ